MKDLEVRGIIRLFDGKLVGTKLMKTVVAETILFFPLSVQQFLTTKCWFMSSFEDAWAFTFRGKDLADEYLVFLSDDLLKQSREQIHFTIAHEIGHIILGHKNAVFDLQTKDEVKRQEKEADQFALNYFPSP